MTLTDAQYLAWEQKHRKSSGSSKKQYSKLWDKNKGSSSYRPNPERLESIADEYEAMQREMRKLAALERLE